MSRRLNLEIEKRSDVTGVMHYITSCRFEKKNKNIWSQLVWYQNFWSNFSNIFLMHKFPADVRKWYFKSQMQCRCSCLRDSCQMQSPRESLLKASIDKKMTCTVVIEWSSACRWERSCCTILWHSKHEMNTLITTSSEIPLTLFAD